MGHIYKIVNKINNKIYIGQTTKKEVDKRLKEHIREARQELDGKRKLTFLHFALLEYGSDNFYIELLEECSKAQLDEREQYWIQYYNTIMPNGYNMTKGGQKVCKNLLYSQSKPVYQYDLNNNLIASFKDSVEAEKITGINSGSIRKVCLGRGISAGGFKWSRKQI